MSEYGAPSTQGSLGRVICILSGASRGFGRSLALQLCSRFLPGSEMLLLSRSQDAMRWLAGELGQSCPGVSVHWETADLSTQEGIARAGTAAKELQGHQTADRLFIINNAGSLGDVSKLFVEFTDPSEVNKYLFFNVSSALCLTSSLLKTFPARPGLQRVVVNVSSLAALQPFKSWSLYCTGKAARDMMFRVLAEEDTDLRVLNYAPGPLDTDMHKLARTETGDHELRMRMIELKTDGKLIDCKDSAMKMVEILQADSYQSGAHVDFADEDE
ncbi:sepiapterin reductase [Pelobates fuscus]|uniref:sepiapterin reductase n=1 Tax=Pelobates fuscus TaxID=191477 RepID=UPI002FE44B40